MRKLLILVAVAFAPLFLADKASAQCPGAFGYGYGVPVYPAPVVVPRCGHWGAPYYPPFRGYGCRSRFRYGSGWGHHHRRHWHRRGWGRSGVGLYFRF